MHVGYHTLHLGGEFGYEIYCINILSSDGHTDGGRKEVWRCMCTAGDEHIILLLLL